MGKELVHVRELGSGEAVELFTVSVKEDHGRNTTDAVFLQHLGVLFLELFVLVRDVDFDQHELLRCFGGELGLGEHFLVHHDARRAPVGSGELDHDSFVFFLSLGDTGIDVCQPVISGDGSSCKCGKSEGGGEDMFDCFHR